jgi:hypothetical protein
MVLDKKLVPNPQAHMQELNLAAIAPTNAAEFRHPLSLLRLAHFVRDASRVRARASSCVCGVWWCVCVGWAVLRWCGVR